MALLHTPLVETDCHELVYHSTLGGFRQCSRKGVVTRDGKPYCKGHDPVVVKAKRAAKNDEYEARYAAERARSKLERAAGLRPFTDAELRAIAANGGLNAVLAGLTVATEKPKASPAETLKEIYTRRSR